MLEITSSDWSMLLEQLACSQADGGQNLNKSVAPASFDLSGMKHILFQYSHIVIFLTSFPLTPTQSIISSCKLTLNVLVKVDHQLELG